MTDENPINIPGSNQRIISSFFRKFEVRKQNNSLIRRYPSTNQTQDNEATGPDLVYKKKSYFDQSTLVIPENRDTKSRRSISSVRSDPRENSSAANIFALTYVEKELTTVPLEVIENKHKLLILDLNLNKFDYFPSEILLLKNLKVLRFDHNRIQYLSEEINSLQQLEVLSISNNLLQVLPHSLNKLANLFDLNVESNHLNSFGPEISELKSLRVLNISKNRYNVFPASFCNLINVTDLCFEWFKYANPPLPPRQRGPEGEHKIFKLRGVCGELRQKNQKGLDFFSFLETVSTAPVNLKVVDRTQKSFLHYAAIYEDTSVMKYLLSDDPGLLDLVDIDGQTALTASILREKYISTKYLLNHGANTSKGGGKYGSALHIAVRKLNLQLVKDLVHVGEVINKLDSDGQTPLHHLAVLMSDGNPKAAAICRYLLEHGANPSIKNKDNWTPLHLSTRRKDLKTLEWMIWYNKEVDEVHGCGPKFKIDQKGGTYKWTAMHIAIYSNAPAIIETLATANCEIFKRSLNGYTPKRLVHQHGMPLKLVEKYEKSYIYKRILFPKITELDDSVDVNLQNLKQATEVYRASKKRFDTDITYEDTSPLAVYTTEKTYSFDNNLKTKPGYESYLPNYRLESKDCNDSIDVAPETDTHYSLPDENGDDVETARHNFCSELNENVTIKTNNFTKELNFSRNVLKLKESEGVQNFSKSKFLIRFAMFLDLDVCSYEQHLSNESNFDLEFCQNELEFIKEYFLTVRVCHTERIKIFSFLRVLHRRILKYISSELNITMELTQYSLLPLQDPLLLAAKKGSDFYGKQKEVQIASLLIDLIPQTLICLYGVISGNKYEQVMLKSNIISLIEEIFCFRTSNFLELVINDPSEATVVHFNAKRAYFNLRNIHETVTLEQKVKKIEEKPTEPGRTRASTPASRPESTNTENASQTRRQTSSERPISSGVRPRTKIALTPFKLLNK